MSRRTPDGAAREDAHLRMDWLNYRHLYYFSVVARTGSVAKASRELRLTHPTVSAQLHVLESTLGAPLFRRSGRGLVLTEVGQTALRYATEIFDLGREFVDVVQRGVTPAGQRLVVGVSDVLPKPIVHRLLEPALRASDPVRVVCREDRTLADFLGDLTTHAVDLVLSDAPAGAEAPATLYSHLLGGCGTAIFGRRETAARLRRGFPRSLAGQPFIVPGVGAVLRRGIEQWFDDTGVRPRVVAEADDSSLAQILAANGHGVLAGPAVMAGDARRLYDLRVVGTIPGLRQRFYAVSAQRRITHPAIAAICHRARHDLFA
ncbi:MAG: LysR family transcriptional regulator [Vicinamibacterales bacterium]